MKTLYLVRHAKSSKDPTGINDEERPLNEQGRHEAAYIAKRLKGRGIMPQVIYSSPAKRALDTAKIVSKEMGGPTGKIKVVDSLYASNIPKLLKVIRGIDDHVGQAAIFGHNPEFLGLVNYFVSRPIEEFPTCGVFAINFESGAWSKVGRKKGRMEFFEFP